MTSCLNFVLFLVFGGDEYEPVGRGLSFAFSLIAPPHENKPFGRVFWGCFCCGENGDEKTGDETNDDEHEKNE